MMTIPAEWEALGTQNQWVTFRFFKNFWFQGRLIRRFSQLPFFPTAQTLTDTSELDCYGPRDLDEMTTVGERLS